MIYAVRFTKASGATGEWHYARRDVAEQVAEQLRGGWRKDARVEPVVTSIPVAGWARL